MPGNASAGTEARPGVPAGTSGGGRQATICVDENAAAGPVAASTNTGSWSSWPAACSTRIQTAPCVAEPVHAVAALEIGTGCPPLVYVPLGSATLTIPVSGNVAPPR